MEESAKWVDSRSKDNTYSLNIDKFKAAQNDIEEKAKKYRPLSDYKNDLIFTSLPYEVTEMKSDVSLKEKRERWHESLSKDIYIEEALNVLDDLQDGSNPKRTVTKIKNDKLKSDKLAKS